MVSLHRVRMHYGHPDVFDRIFHITRGGISKASRIINISEDIYSGEDTLAYFLVVFMVVHDYRNSWQLYLLICGVLYFYMCFLLLDMFPSYSTIAYCYIFIFEWLTCNFLTVLFTSFPEWKQVFVRWSYTNV